MSICPHVPISSFPHVLMYPCPYILMSPMSLCPNVCMFSCPYVLRLKLLRNGLDSSRKGAINRNISGITALLDEFNLWTTVTHKPPRQSFSRHFTAVLHQCLSLYPIAKTFWLLVPIVEANVRIDQWSLEKSNWQLYSVWNLIIAK